MKLLGLVLLAIVIPGGIPIGIYLAYRKRNKGGNSEISTNSNS